jgi:hypothetical protein
MRMLVAITTYIGVVTLRVMSGIVLLSLATPPDLLII